MSIRKTGEELNMMQTGIKQSRYIDTDGDDEIEIGDVPEY